MVIALKANTVEGHYHRISDTSAGNSHEYKTVPQPTNVKDFSKLDWENSLHTNASDIDPVEFRFARFDDCDPTRVVFRTEKTIYSALVFRQLSDLATAIEESNLSSVPENHSQPSHHDDMKACGRLEGSNVSSCRTSPESNMKIITQSRDTVDDYPIQGLRVDWRKEEISLDWCALSSRCFGKRKTMYKSSKVSALHQFAYTQL